MSSLLFRKLLQEGDIRTAELPKLSNFCEVFDSFPRAQLRIAQRKCDKAGEHFTGIEEKICRRHFLNWVVGKKKAKNVSF